MADTDGNWRLQRADGTLSNICILILAGELDWGLSRRSNSAMQICGFSAQALAKQWGSRAVADTVLPAVGLEIFGHGFR